MDFLLKVRPDTPLFEGPSSDDDDKSVAAAAVPLQLL
jgi:hypothetical protein